jgi:hypothetical protein
LHEYSASSYRDTPQQDFVMAKKGEPNGKCCICSHEQRYQIELALVSGVSCRAIGLKFKVSRDGAWRHLRNHVTDARRSELVAGPLTTVQLAERAADEHLSLLDYLAIVRNALMARFLAASECDDRQGSAMVAGRLLECLRTIARLTGELTAATSNVTTNIAIMSSPLMADLQGMLIRELQPFPDARLRVIAGLEELSRRALPSSPAMAALPKGETFDVV